LGARSGKERFMEKDQKLPAEVLELRTQVKRLGLRLPDVIASLYRAAVGAGGAMIPLLGVLGEGASYIPGQRLDRVERFLEVLVARLEAIEADSERVRKHLLTPEGSDLYEHSFQVAARTLDEEKRQAIADLFARSLSGEELKYAQTKKLLEILDDLDAPELIFLKHYAAAEKLGAGHASEVYQRHEHLLRPVTGEAGAPKEVADWRAVQATYPAKLQRLGLVHERDSTNVTYLGMMLLEYIGIE
jgi:hypothetical protein